MTTFEPAELSEREQEILRLVATGASNKEIAQQLYISSNTVKVHLRNIFTKIGAASRTEAAMYAVRIGLVLAVSEKVAVEGEQITPEAGTEITSFSTSEQLTHSEPTLPRKPAWHRVWLPLVALLIIITGIGFTLMRFTTPAATPTLSAATALPSPTSIPRWKELAAMPTARSGLALAAFENQIYAIGGSTLNGVTGAVERYDPVANNWIDLSPKPIPVTEVHAAVIGGLIYVPGGRDNLNSQDPTDILEIYDPALDRWSRGASLPTPLSGYALIAYEGRIYIFGGWDGSSVQNGVYEYDPLEDLWRVRSPMPTARTFCGAAESGGMIYVIGGSAEGKPLDTIEIYSPVRDAAGTPAWETGNPLPQARYGMGVTDVADLIYLVGGSGDGGENLEPLEFSPATHQWNTFYIPLPESWSFMGMLSLGPNLYMAGGQIQGFYSPLHLSYQAIYTVTIPIVQDQP
jgi:DNA-binding CsgD family transcriptional regulator